MSEPTAHVGVLTVEILIPAAHSLKEKRFVLKSIKDRSKNKFNASIAEIGYQDKWQRSAMGFSIIGNDKAHIESQLQGILDFLSSIHDMQISHDQITFV